MERGRGTQSLGLAPGFAFKTRVAVAVTLLLTIAFVVLATPAPAHVPGFSADNDDPGNATYVDAPAKSWSFYDRIETNESAYYRTSLERGDRLVVNTFTPRGGEVAASDGRAAGGTFDPGVVVMSPALNGTTGVPAQVEVPEGYGARVVDPTGQPSGEFEPFTPAALYRHAELDTTVETSGTYYVVAYDRDGDPGRVGVVVGHTESFAVDEYLAVPFDRPRIHRWEGQSPWLVYSPFLVGFIWVVRSFVRRTDAPEGAPVVDGGDSLGRSPRGMALAVAAGLYAATGAAVAVQLAIAVSLVGVTASVLVTLVFLAVPLGLARYVLGCATAAGRTERRRRGALVVVSVLGLLTWAGFVLGPAVTFAVALLPD